MNKLIIFLSVTAIAVFIMVSCRKSLTGDGNANKTPNTYTIIDTIIRSGQNRFQSIVKIHWWGDDPDGFVKYYQYTFDKTITANTQWHKVVGQDSTFVLIVPNGIDTANFIFSVRSVDNKGAVDPTPVRVGYPIKNSPPTILFVPGIYNPTYTFPIVRLYWQASDPDGSDNIDHIELIWNDTTLRPTSVKASVSSAIFEATNLTTTNITTRIYPNNNLAALDSVVSNLKLKNNNQLFIRAVDKAGAKSKWVASFSMYVRKPKGDKLLVDAYKTPSANVESFYGQCMVNKGYSIFDTLKLFASNPIELAADNATQTKIFALFKTIIWFGDNTNSSLGIVDKTTNDFFTNGGKMFMANRLEPSFDANSPQLSITPAQSLYNNSDTTLLFPTDSLANAAKSGWATLKDTAFISVIKPMQLGNGTVNLYSSHLSVKDNVHNQTPPYPLWTGTSSIIAERLNGNNQPVFIYSEVELHLLNGNHNIDLVWAKILGEFGL